MGVLKYRSEKDSVPRSTVSSRKRRSSFQPAASSSARYAAKVRVKEKSEGKSEGCGRDWGQVGLRCDIIARCRQGQTATGNSATTQSEHSQTRAVCSQSMMTVTLRRSDERRRSYGELGSGPHLCRFLDAHGAASAQKGRAGAHTGTPADSHEQQWLDDVTKCARSLRTCHDAPKQLWTGSSNVSRTQVSR